MWIIPSFGRPEAVARLTSAPGGMPDDVLVVVNDDDPRRDEYLTTSPFQVLVAPAGSRHTDAINYAFARHPNEPCYGLLDDDYRPVTPRWWEAMERAAGAKQISLANNLINFPQMLAARCMGGDLARAVGCLGPGTMRQNYSDNTWSRIASDFGLLRPLSHIIVEHHHHLFDPAVAKDATYERGSHDIAEDEQRFRDWLMSPERQAMNARIGALVGLPEKRILAAVVAYNGMIEPIVSTMLIEAAEIASARGWSFEVRPFVEDAILPRLRNGIVATFMNGVGTDLVMIDNDNACSGADLIQLVEAKADIVGAAVRSRLPALTWPVRWLTDRPELIAVDPESGEPSEDGLLEVESIGTGILRLSRACLERMIEHYRDDWYHDINCETGRAWPLFEYERRDHLWWGEDITFCLRWRALGGKVWVDPRIGCRHVGRITYAGNLGEWLRGDRGGGNTEINFSLLDQTIRKIADLQTAVKDMGEVVGAHKKAA